MNTQYVGKTQAVAEMMQQTGFGRFIIERKMNELLTLGKIKLLDDPADIRRKLISRQDMDVIVKALTNVGG